MASLVPLPIKVWAAQNSRFRIKLEPSDKDPPVSVGPNVGEHGDLAPGPWGGWEGRHGEGDHVGGLVADGRERRRPRVALPGLEEEAWNEAERRPLPAQLIPS